MHIKIRKGERYQIRSLLKTKQTTAMSYGCWVCSVARLQRWRTVGEGPQYLKILGKVLYRLKDIEAFEEACLIRKVF